MRFTGRLPIERSESRWYVVLKWKRMDVGSSEDSALEPPNGILNLNLTPNLNPHAERPEVRMGTTITPEGE
jgi:hypothetical protein